jgi:hypothetical protein
MINSTSSYASKTIVVFDRITKGLKSFNKEKNPLNSKSPENKKNKYSGLLFYILSTILITNEKKLLLVLMVSIAYAFIKNCKKSRIKGNESIVVPKMKFYLWWCLKFLTPLQKCIRERADEYDINPINNGSWVKYVKKRPALCFLLSRVRVFFSANKVSVLILV